MEVSVIGAYLRLGTLLELPMLEIKIHGAYEYNLEFQPLGLINGLNIHLIS
jgi:hypothetical protein